MTTVTIIQRQKGDASRSYRVHPCPASCVKLNDKFEFHATEEEARAVAFKVADLFLKKLSMA